MLLARRAQLSLLRASTRAHSITAGVCSPAAASRGTRTAAAQITFATRPSPRSLATGSRAFAGSPARAFATTSDDDRTKEKEPSRWEKLRQLFREHGLAFGALYVGANVVTFIPIFGALTFGGVDGPELILWAADQLEITYDLSFVETIHKDLVNAFIALELNAWVEPVRLPAVIAYTPRASRWLKARRGGEVPVKAEPEPAPEEPAAPTPEPEPAPSKPARNKEKRRRRRRGG
jgi:hypothetical protein